VQYLKKLFRTLPRTEEVITCVAHACLDIWPEELKDELGKSFKDGLIDPFTFDWDDVERSLVLGLDASMSRLRDHYKLVTDVHKELSWWYCFLENREPARDVASHRVDQLFSVRYPENVAALPFEPIFAAASAPRIGRNEPCACGSGKKFKKCCGP
jgi:uncharacterized protein YecA (UPF0149 family)